MLPTGHWAAPTTCLRCQLRQVILGPPARARPQCVDSSIQHQSRCFNGSRRQWPELEAVQAFDDGGRANGKSKLSKHPLGRIVGKPGRRQRESSARLKTDAMKKPFDVIVMRDVPEPKDEKKPGSTIISSTLETGITGARIAREVLQAGEEPSQAEVEESINSMRPETTLLDEKQYKELTRNLLDSYNTQQLSLYLTKALELSSVDADEVRLIREEPSRSRSRLRTTPWRPGRTALERRHGFVGVVKKSELGTNRSKSVQQIMRLAWNLTIHSEMQQVGELEVSLHRWQVRYLFDLSLDKMPMYEAMLDSPLLRRISEIRPFRPDNIMRITARRQDAEDVAAQIEQKLQQVRSLEIDLAVFGYLLGRPGWPDWLDQLFGEAVLDKVERRTATVIERSDFKTLIIHARSEVSLQHARRVLLAALNLPSPRTTEITDLVATPVSSQETRARSDRLLLPEPDTSGLPFRYRDLTLGRLSVKTRLAVISLHAAKSDQIESKSQPGAYDARKAKAGLHTQALGLSRRLAGITPFHPMHGTTTTDKESYWKSQTYLQPQPWAVQFCKILHPAARALDITSPTYVASKRKRSTAPCTKSLMDGSKLSIVQPQIPGVARLLSNFAPRDVQQGLVTLVAHFMPSPLTRSGVAKMESLPRIEISYGLSPPEPRLAPEEYQNLQIISMQAILAEQELRVPMPEEAVDLRIHRSTILPAQTGRASHDPEISKFTEVLDSSMMRGDGALEGKPNVKFYLPSWLFVRNLPRGRDEKGRIEFEVDYLFERFEQVQTTDFAPRRFEGNAKDVDPKMREVLSRMPRDLCLRYTEAEGGLVGGRRSELSLKYQQSPKKVLPHEWQLEQTNAMLPEKGDTMIPAQDVTEEQTLRLLDTALGLADILTKIHTGERRQSIIGVKDLYEE